MARIVLGLASSHTPQLSSPVETWPHHGENDKKNPWLFDRQGRRVSYEEALAAADPGIAARELNPDKQRQRHEAAQQAVARLQDALAEVAPDVVVVFGDDQAEIFPHDFRPALMVHWGDTAQNMPDLFTRAPYEAGRKAGWAYGPERADIPVNGELGKEIVEHLIDAGFDVASARKLDDKGLGHAFGFVFGRLMNGKTIPIVPVIINTLYPPNQPTAGRCYELGRAVRQAIEDWPSDARVAIAGSGGLSHFIIDEEIDQRFIAALRSKKAADFAALPRERLESGTGELRSWTGAAGALEELDLAMMEYYPCYRSPAGTGVAMGFALWR